jgi:glycerophosphoryl diester phosphodiesterase
MYRDTQCKLQAHRGVCTEAPENTMAAFRLAVQQDYDIIEFDPKFTKDNVCVILHDRTLNRTVRVGGKELGEEKVYVADKLYAEVKMMDVGSWFSPDFAGERMPLLSDVLTYARKAEIECKIDNIVQTFTPEQIEIVFSTVEKCGGRVGLTCSDLSLLQTFAKRFPKAPLHYDGEVTSEALDTLASFCEGHETTVWMRLADNPRTAWNKMPPATPELAALVRERFALGIWILATDEEMEMALALHADVVETTGGIKPAK